MDRPFETVEDVRKGFEEEGYVCSQRIAVTLFLAHHLQNPGSWDLSISGPGD